MSDSGPATRSSDRSAWLDMDPDYWTASSRVKTPRTTGAAVPARTALDRRAGDGRRDVLVHLGARLPDQDPAQLPVPTLLVRLDVREDLRHGNADRLLAEVEPLKETGGASGDGPRCDPHAGTDLERRPEAIGDSLPVAHPIPGRRLERVAQRMAEVEGDPDVARIPLVLR